MEKKRRATTKQIADYDAPMRGKRRLLGMNISVFCVHVFRVVNLSQDREKCDRCIYSGLRVRSWVNRGGDRIDDLLGPFGGDGKARRLSDTTHFLECVEGGHGRARLVLTKKRLAV